MKTIQGDLLDIEEGIICHQVNCKGVMGKGLALQVRSKYPEVYTYYKNLYNNGDLKLGHTFFVRVTDKLVVANLCGQDYPGKRTNYEALISCFMFLGSLETSNFTIPPLKGQKIYIPKGLGCGIGGGDWTYVSFLINKYIPNAIIMENNRKKYDSRIDLSEAYQKNLRSS